MGRRGAAASDAPDSSRVTCRQASADGRGARLTAIAFLVVAGNGGDGEWFDHAAAADAAAARQLTLSPAQLEPLRRRITVDPLVVRHAGSRWRSRQVWNIRGESSAVRIYEMLQIDEAAYDH